MRPSAATSALDANFAQTDATLAKLSAGAAAASAHRSTVVRFRADLGAARFHLKRPADIPPLVAILGGTGTGKSTLLNRLLDSNLTATSFRRTFTAGCVAVAASAEQVPRDWLGIEHRALGPEDLPARGEIDRLDIVIAPREGLTDRVTLIDTPDLDGDQPAHHAQADRAFRWADAIVFLVTPEKYQMTELLPYYRLARRYGTTCLFVMNKAAEQAVVEDYARQIESARVYAVPRDDAAFEPPAEANLESLRGAIGSIVVGSPAPRIAARTSDLAGRLRDQIVDPLRSERSRIDELIRSLRAMETPSPGVDVNPLTEQLQRRLQQRSVLYLMGPGRIFDRVRQMPGLLARLPRTTWDLLRRGKLTNDTADGSNSPKLADDHPDFRNELIDQFAVVQSRIDDLVRSNETAARLAGEAGTNYESSKLEQASAGRIADEEIAALKLWLETQWNATPRDTAMLQKLLSLLPGGKKLAKWSEAAPYLLAIVVATHHAFFGHIDLLILGGYSIATWLSERVSNQVAWRTRAANAAIALRFSRLAHRQIERTCAWLNEQVPDSATIETLAKLSDQAAELSDALRSHSIAEGAR